MSDQNEHETQPPASNWRDSIPDDLREHPSLASIQDVGSLAKGYVHAQSMVGADKIVVPGKDADEDVWGAVYSKLGRPESADKYEFERPDIPQELQYDERIEQVFKESAHRAGLNPRQAQRIYNDYMTALLSEATKNTEELKERYRKDEESLRKEFGKALPQVFEMNKRVIDQYGGPELKTLIDSGLGREPAIVRFLDKLVKAMGEDKFKGSDPGMFKTPQSALDEISRRMADPQFMDAYRSKFHPGHEDAVRKMYELRQQAHPETTA